MDFVILHHRATPDQPPLKGRAGASRILLFPLPRSGHDGRARGLWQEGLPGSPSVIEAAGPFRPPEEPRLRPPADAVRAARGRAAAAVRGRESTALAPE